MSSDVVTYDWDAFSSYKGLQVEFFSFQTYVFVRTEQSYNVRFSLSQLSQQGLFLGNGSVKKLLRIKLFQLEILQDMSVEFLMQKKRSLTKLLIYTVNKHVSCGKAKFLTQMSESKGLLPHTALPKSKTRCVDWLSVDRSNSSMS